MSDYVDTREGWREATRPEAAMERESVSWRRPGHPVRSWVREDSVPPLPTEPYSVIGVTWKYPVDQGNGTVLTLIDGEWCFGDVRYGSVLSDSITGFEVLARPMPDYDSDDQFAERVRRETAKVVIHRISQLVETGSTADEAFWQAAGEYGVEL